MLLEARGLSVAYGDAPAIRDVSLRVGAGEVVSVIGPNGAGKTTLVNTIAGLQRARAGALALDGVDLARLRSHLVCRHGIALVPEGRRLFARMTVEENLELGAYRGAARRHRAEGLGRVYRLFPILSERRRQIAGSLSGGQQQMVAIGRALMARPRLLMLDEPSLGLAPVTVSTIFASFARINREGVTVLLVEQNVLRALRLSQRAYVLENGVVALEGPSERLLAAETVRRAYLGR